MVGRHARAFYPDGSNKQSDASRQPLLSKNRDIESGSQPARVKPKIWAFRDAAATAVADERRRQIKETLLNAVDRDSLKEYRKSDDELKEIKNKAVRTYYESQNDRIDDWIEVDTVVMALADDVLDSMNPDPDGDGIRERHGGLQDLHGNIWEFLPEEMKQARAKGEKNARLAININVVANVLLLAAKVVAAFYSSSLSLIASLVDSALDLLCTLIVWTTNRLVQWRLSSLNKRFPVGRRRLEPLGILVFAVIMVISFLQILQESVQKLLPGGEHAATNLPALAIAAMAGTIIIKGIIGLGCVRVKTTQVQALAQDCKTDVYFNTLSLLFPLIGAQFGVWWLDPLGAALLSLFIIYDWGDTCFQQIARLSGQATSTELQKKLMYLVWRFAPVVEGFKSITSYHAGDGIWVEIDILMDGASSLESCHDVAETLQYCCEGLAEVDRAFVTIDYTSFGPSGHAMDAERT